MKTATHVSSRTDRIFQTTQSVYRLSEPVPFGGEDEGIEGRAWFVLVSTTSIRGVGDPESHLETAVIPCLESGTHIGFSLLEVATDDKTAALRQFGYEPLPDLLTELSGDARALVLHGQDRADSDGFYPDAPTRREIALALLKRVESIAGKGRDADGDARIEAIQMTLGWVMGWGDLDLPEVDTALVAHFERGEGK